MAEIVKITKDGVIQYPITKPEAVIDENGKNVLQLIRENGGGSGGGSYDDTGIKKDISDLKANDALQDAELAKLSAEIIRNDLDIKGVVSLSFLAMPKGITTHPFITLKKGHSYRFKGTASSISDKPIYVQIKNAETTLASVIIKAGESMGIADYTAEEDVDTVLSFYSGSPIPIISLEIEDNMSALAELGKLVFNGYYSNSKKDDIVTPGVYIRKDSSLSRGQLLFVSQSSDGTIVYQMECYISNTGQEVKQIRKKENDTWSDWETLSEETPYSRKVYQPSDIKYISHRGVRNQEIPESTTYSVMFAALYGSKYAECDVCYTSDGVGVIMHDETINRTMRNADNSVIVSNITIADNTYETLSQYVYKSTNPIYRTKLQTLKEYVDACKLWNICPIIQGPMSSADLEYCMKNLGDNWICYGGNFSEVRQYSDNVLCLTAASYDSVDKLIDILSNNIGGNVGISRIGNNKLTDEEISACKIRGWEVMASYAYDKANIPTAIERGATIILSDNIGKDVHSILASSIGGWENFNYDGQIANGMLNLEMGQYISLPLTKKGNYKVFSQFDGDGICTLPSYDDRGNFIQQDFPMLSGTFVCPTLYIEDGETTMNIVAESAMSIKTLIVFYDAY